MAAAAMARPGQRLATRADDLLHDVAYDFYGKRLAVCSSDKTVEVYDLPNDRPVHKIMASAGSVLRVVWAHPEFGTMLAFCGTDRTVRVYEEQVETTTNTRLMRPKATLTESVRADVRDVKFAPRNHGLKLASAAADGFVRIYESKEPSLALSMEFSVGETCQALDWNPNPFDPSMLVAAAGRDLKIFELREAKREKEELLSIQHPDMVNDVSWSPSLGRGYHLIASACKDQRVRVHKISKQGTKWTQSLVMESDIHKAEVWRVQWNVTGTLLASAGDDGAVRVFRRTPQGNFAPILNIKEPDGSRFD